MFSYFKIFCPSLFCNKYIFFYWLYTHTQLKSLQGSLKFSKKHYTKCKQSILEMTLVLFIYSLWSWVPPCLHLHLCLMRFYADTWYVSATNRKTFILESLVQEARHAQEIKNLRRICYGAINVCIFHIFLLIDKMSSAFNDRNDIQLNNLLWCSIEHHKLLCQLNLYCC